MPSIKELHKVTGGTILTKVSNIETLYFDNVKSLANANESSLIWVKGKGKQDIIDSTLAQIIVLPEGEEFTVPTGKVLILVDNPRLAFIKAVEAFFVSKPQPSIHPTAYVHPEATIHEEAYIGPFSYVGKSAVGKNTVIHGNIYIYDDVDIGENVIIHSGTVIGADGFGFEKNEKGEVFKFPHVGGVLVEDNVEIGSNTCIDRGTLDNTILRKGCKIDNLVHIGHYVEVGENAFVIANAMIGGSTKVGAGAWIAPSVSLMNGIKINENATIGMAAFVTKNVPAGETWTGVPARPLAQFVYIQRKLKKL
jgi:UDP-3-O-[3-hydroxymyristoyl] glucosamine N-acyltransferase